MDSKIDLYKIGHQSLNRSKDSNAACHEYDLIEDALERYKPIHRLHIIIGGKFSDEEERRILLEHMDQFNEQHDSITIFIATDEIVFTDNLDVIKRSNVVLHQSERFIKKLPCAKQYYNWIPELFYEDKPMPSCKKQKNTLCFGGGTRGNEILINQFIIDANMETSLKTETEDNRMTAEEYHVWQQSHAFTLIISRPLYQRIGWVTARFVEALSDWCYPIQHVTYDIDEHFDYVYRRSLDTISPYESENMVDTPQDAIRLMNRITSTSLSKNLALQKMRYNLKKNKYNFLGVIALVDNDGIS